MSGNILVEPVWIICFTGIWCLEVKIEWKTQKVFLLNWSHLAPLSSSISEIDATTTCPIYRCMTCNSNAQCKSKSTRDLTLFKRLEFELLIIIFWPKQQRSLWIWLTNMFYSLTCVSFSSILISFCPIKWSLESMYSSNFFILDLISNFLASAPMFCHVFRIGYSFLHLED